MLIDHTFKELPIAQCLEDIDALLPWKFDTESLKGLY